MSKYFTRKEAAMAGELEAPYMSREEVMLAGQQLDKVFTREEALRMGMSLPSRLNNALPGGVNVIDDPTSIEE